MLVLILVLMNTNGDDSFVWFLRLSVSFGCFSCLGNRRGAALLGWALNPLGPEGPGTPCLLSCLQSGELGSSCSPVRNNLHNSGHASNMLRCEIVSCLLAGFFFFFFFFLPFFLSRRDCIICLYFTACAAGERNGINQHVAFIK